MCLISAGHPVQFRITEPSRYALDPPPPLVLFRIIGFPLILSPRPFTRRFLLVLRISPPVNCLRSGPFLTLPRSQIIKFDRWPGIETSCYCCCSDTFSRFYFSTNSSNLIFTWKLQREVFYPRYTIENEYIQVSYPVLDDGFRIVEIYISILFPFGSLAMR